MRPSLYDRFANALFGALMELTEPARTHLVNPPASCSDTKPASDATLHSFALA
jgi:hypothetical protein